MSQAVQKPERHLPIGRVETLFFLVEKSFDLLQALLVFRDIEILLDDGNKHIEHDHYNTVSERNLCPGNSTLQFAKMNQRIQNEAPIHERPEGCRYLVTLYKMDVQSSLEKI